MPKKTPHPAPELTAELVGEFPFLLALYAAVDVESLRTAIFALLHALFPCEFVCLVLQQGPEICQETFRDKYPFASVEELAYFNTAMPAGERFWMPPRRKFFRYTDLISPAEVRKTEFYRRVMRPQDWLYYAGLFVWEKERMLSLVVAHRSERRGDFSEREMAIFQALHPHFEAAVRRLISLHREQATLLVFEQLVRSLPLPALLLAWDQRVLYHNPAARDVCERWQAGATGLRQRKRAAPFRVPPDLLAACRSLRARHERAGNKGHLPVALTSAQTPGLRVTIDLAKGGRTSIAEPAFLIQFFEEPDSQPAETRRPRLALLSRLTSTEREIALAAYEGASNREIARRRGKSEATVKKQLQSAYRKLGVSRRTQLAALFHESASG